LSAVRQELALQFALEQAAATLNQAAAARQRQAGMDQSADAREQPPARQPRRQHAREVASLPCHAQHEAAAERRVGADRQELVMGQPGHQPPPHHIGAPGQIVPAAAVVDPAPDQLAPGAPAVVAARRPQVAQPLEAMKLREPGWAGAHRSPEGCGIADGLAAEGEDAVADGGAPGGVARPTVGRQHGCRPASDARRQQQPVKPTREQRLTQIVPDLA
jgi:hypothetical protein